MQTTQRKPWTWTHNGQFAVIQIFIGFTYIFYKHILFAHDHLMIMKTLRFAINWIVWSTPFIQTLAPAIATPSTWADWVVKWWGEKARNCPQWIATGLRTGDPLKYDGRPFFYITPSNSTTLYRHTLILMNVADNVQFMYLRTCVVAFSQ